MALLLDIVVADRFAVIKLLASEDQPLLLWRDTLFVLRRCRCTRTGTGTGTGEYQVDVRWTPAGCQLAQRVGLQARGKA
jgi:hypothetical protein